MVGSEQVGGQVDVEPVADDDLGPADRGGRRGRAPRGIAGSQAHDGQMALALEIAPDQLRLLPVVFGDEDPGWHATTMTDLHEISMKIG